MRVNTINLFAGVLLFLIPVYWLVNSTVNMPWSDEWNFLPFIERGVTGNLKFKDFFELYNGHSYFVLRLIFLASAIFDDFNLNNLRYLNLAILAAVAILLTRLVEKVSCKPVFSGLLSLFLVLSLRQWESLGWSMLIVQYLTLIALLIAINSYECKKYLIVFIFVLVLPLLTGNGLLGAASLIFISIAKIIAEKRVLSDRVFFLGVIFSLAVVPVSLLVFLGGDLFRIAVYTIKMMGGAFVDSALAPSLIIALGLINIFIHCSAVWIFFRNVQKRDLREGEFSLVVLVLFSFLNVYGAIYGRLLQGVDQPDASRYALFVIPGTVAAFCFITNNEILRKLTIPLFLSAALSALFVNIEMLKMAPHMRSFSCASWAYIVGETKEKSRFYLTGLPDYNYDAVVSGVEVLRRNELSFINSPPSCE